MLLNHKNFIYIFCCITVLDRRYGCSCSGSLSIRDMKSCITYHQLLDVPTTDEGTFWEQVNSSTKLSHAYFVDLVFASWIFFIKIDSPLYCIPLLSDIYHFRQSYLFLYFSVQWLHYNVQIPNNKQYNKRYKLF